MVFNENLNNRASWTEGRQTDGQTDGRTDRGTDGQMDGQTDVLQDFVPFGATALLPLQFTNMQSRATGIAYHTLPLGDRFWL